jgi:5'-3' exonuclease
MIGQADKSDNIKGISGLGYKNIVKYFSFLTTSKPVEIDDILTYAQQKVDEGDRKYLKILENKEIIKRNYELMQLKNTIMSATNIKKVKDILEQKPTFGMVSLKKKIIEDGLEEINDKFMQSFLFL